jgi:chromosome segregation ATPase
MTSSTSDRQPRRARPRPERAPFRSRRRIRQNMTNREDIASVAAQLAELTRTVEAMAKDLKVMTERADRQQTRADDQQTRADDQETRADNQQARADNQRAIADSQDDLALMQQERIDLAARELAEVSHRLQAAATMLQESVEEV